MTKFINPTSDVAQQRGALEDIIREAQRTGQWVYFRFGDRRHRLGYAPRGRWGDRWAFFVGFNEADVMRSYQGGYYQIDRGTGTMSLDEVVREMILGDIAHWSSK